MVKLLILLFALVAVAAAAENCTVQLEAIAKCSDDLKGDDLKVPNCNDKDKDKSPFYLCVTNKTGDCDGDDLTKKGLAVWKAYAEAVNSALCDKLNVSKCEDDIAKALKTQDLSISIGVLPFMMTTPTLLKEPGCKFQQLAFYEAAFKIQGNCTATVSTYLENLYKETKCGGSENKPEKEKECWNQFPQWTKNICMKMNTTNGCNDTTDVDCWGTIKKGDPCKLGVVTNYFDTAIAVTQKTVKVLSDNKGLCEFFNNNTDCWDFAIQTRERVIQENRDAFTDEFFSILDSKSKVKDECKAKLDEFKKALKNAASGIQTISFVITAVVALMIMKLY